MSETATRLLDSVLALPDDERAALRDALDESLHDAGADAEFDAVLTKRMDDIRSGRVKAVPGEEFFRQLRERGA